MYETPLILPGLRPLYDRLLPMAYTVLRVLAAGMMLQFGFKKLFLTGVGPDLAHMQNLGLEPAIVWAYFVVSVEFFASLGVVLGLLTRPLALVLGLLTRPLALVLLGLVSVMLVTVLIPRGEGYQLGLVWWGAFAVIAMRGGGPYALDRLIGKEF